MKDPHAAHGHHEPAGHNGHGSHDGHESHQHHTPGQRAAAPAQPPAAGEAVEYTCPMHPEIVRSEPGSCPICGMHLEPRRITLDDKPDHALIDMRRRFWVATALSVPLVIIGMAEMLPAALRGWLDRAKVAWESLLSFKRAGCDGVLTYFARDIARMIAEEKK